jgi:hypothetical protein
MKVDRVYFVVCNDFIIGKASTDVPTAASSAREHWQDTGHRPIVVGVDVMYVHDPIPEE